MSTQKPEQTFRAYTAAQGQTYDQTRFRYHPNFFKRVLDHHTSTGGQLGTVIDVGCGPGIATRELAPFFTHAIGADPSEGMILTAKKAGGSSATENIQYICSSAEALDCGAADGTVDLITAATAAHWFDMPGFWARSEQLLRPGGSVAIWTMTNGGVHGDVPNHEAINRSLEEIRKRELEPFYGVGNQLARGLYVDLGLPWTVSPAVSGFEKDSFLRTEWGTEGNADAEQEGEEFLVNGQSWVKMSFAEALMGTGSPITRWREANPSKTGEEDVVRVMRREMEKLLKEAGVAEEDMAFKVKMTGVLLVVKKK